MPSALPMVGDVSIALEQASKDYAERNIKSRAIHAKALSDLPGGTTRNVIHFQPFPLVFARGEGPHVIDADGHRYLDFCGEYSAAMFGHSHPVVSKAMVDAINNGFALGGVNKSEGRAAQLICDRFPSIEKVRFSNSGTEANMTALSLVRAYTGRETIMVFQGAYHGGLATFSKDRKAGARTMNSPLKWLVVPYNDTASMETAVEENKDDLACIFVELMQGSSGCVPSNVEFIQRLREKATETGAVLMFDEVMTSRMSAGGLQGLLRIQPDMTTLGKYFAGGGQNFGAFGGKDEIMSLIEPGRPGGVYHSGTYNNNPTTMAALVAVLEKVWTPEEAIRLYAWGDWLRTELTQLSRDANSSLQVIGVGSLINIHFANEPIRDAADVQAGNLDLRELFFFDMLNKGIFLAQRGMVSLMTVHTKEQLQSFVDATKEFLEEREELVSR